MKLLLDSNVLLWSIADRRRLTPRVRNLLEDDGNELIVSLASVWELAIKVAKGKLVLPGSSVRSLLDQVRQIGILLLPISPSHVLRMETLPHHHGDPFDRILIAQAIEEDLTLVTADREIPLYSVTVIWS